MSITTRNEFEVVSQTLIDGRRIIIIEYEVTRKEINRYDIKIDEK